MSQQVDAVGLAEPAERERRLSEHIDLNPLLHAVEGMTPAQVGGEPV